MNLPSVDDLFTTQEERDQKNQEYVKDISIYEITDFPNHPFKVKMDDKMLETIESVRDQDVYKRQIYIGGGQMIHAATYGVGVIVGPVQSGMIYVRY